MSKTALKLLVLDIDNTVFDWVTYYVNAMNGLFSALEAAIGVPAAELADEARAVFTTHRSIEYPFLVQELPAVNKYFGDDIDRMLSEAVEPARIGFNRAARDYLVPYPEVIPTLAKIRQLYPDTPVVALTDAPRYVAMWKLNKLGLLPLFDAVYGLPDPTLPTCNRLRRVKVDPEILLKHLQRSNFGFGGRIRILPDDYEKPGTKGLQTVLMDYEVEERGIARNEILWVGDNLRKDVGLGLSLKVRTAWAKYGTLFDHELKASLLAFSPMENVHKNVALSPSDPSAPVADNILEKFEDLLAVLK